MTDYTEDFQATWNRYPKRNGKRVGKQPAFKEWKKLPLEDRRKAYADIRDRTEKGGWPDFIRDMERYLKRREWEDDWSPARVGNNPQAAPRTNTVDQAVRRVPLNSLCKHQVRGPWTYLFSHDQCTGIVIADCTNCDCEKGGRKGMRIAAA